MITHVRLMWSSETDLDNAFASGELWIAYAWPNDWVIMKSKGLKVAYMHPKEGPISCIGMLMLGKNTSRPVHAHAFADAWSSVQSAKWLEDNYGYGEANTLARPKSSDLLKVLQLTFLCSRWSWNSRACSGVRTSGERPKCLANRAT